MATTYSTIGQAQAAYDTLLKQKQRVQRDDYVGQQQAIMGVNNYLKQQGYNGGAAESILLRARQNRTDVSNYDSQLADLAAIIKGFQEAAALAAAGSGGSGGGSSSKPKSSNNQTLTGVGTGKYASIPSDVYFKMFQQGNALYDSKAANTYVPTGQYTISTKNGSTVYDSRFKQPVTAAANAAKKIATRRLTT